MNGFNGETLEWVEPPEEEIIYIPESPKIPPWIDPDVDYVSEELTYVDGEWVNLDLIEIAGNRTVADIDLNGDG